MRRIGKDLQNNAAESWIAKPHWFENASGERKRPAVSHGLAEQSFVLLVPPPRLRICCVAHYVSHIPSVLETGREPLNQNDTEGVTVLGSVGGRAGSLEVCWSKKTTDGSGGVPRIQIIFFSHIIEARVFVH